MSNVIPLRGPTVDAVIKSLADLHAKETIQNIMVVVIDNDGFPQFAFSPTSNERVIFMADQMMQKAREQLA